MGEQQELVTITIDGHEISVPPGTLLWEAARRLGIEIPIYCYHPKMDPLGACRMCFVEVKGMPKPMTACTTTVAPNMVVSTDSPMVKKSRRGTLEFLLINHPLDCPICDKGGECDLQDFTLRHGPGGSRFDLSKRHFPKPVPVSENILLDRERCITCHRCVRFCQDVAMENGLVTLERGFRTEIGVEVDAPFDSIFSGNVVEMCPVGALTAKSYRFVTRPWELQRTDSVCGLCSVGCNVKVDVRVNRLMRQYSRTNDSIDEGFLCDRGRWNMDAVNSPERLRAPMVRNRNGELAPASWDEALRVVGQRLREVVSQHGASAVGGIGSTHTTNEEAYLFQKLLRAGLGTNNVDHYHGRFPAVERNGLPWVWSDSIAGLEKASVIVLLGTDTYYRQPIIDLRIRRAIRKGTRVYVVTPEPARLDRLAAGTIRYAAGQTGAVARALLSTVVHEQLTRGDFAAKHAASVESLRVSLGDASALATSAGADVDALRALAREIAAASGAVLLYDEMATREPTGATLPPDVLQLALLTDNFGRPGAGVGPLMEDNNSLGARDMGLLPDQLPGYRALADGASLAKAWGMELPEAAGKDYEAMLGGEVRALYIMGADPANHATPEQLANLEALDFLVVQDLFLTETAKRAAVVLPAVAYTEKEGTFTNTERAVQVVRRAMMELPGARPDWQILSEVANALGLDWRYRSPSEILAEISRVVPLYAGVSRRSLGREGARWPFSAGESGAQGKPALVGSSCLTWEMLEHGVAGSTESGEEPVVSRGSGEQS